MADWVRGNLLSRSALPAQVVLPVILLLVLLFPTISAESLAPPNVVWIIADDLGTDLECYGHPAVATPHLDRLAEEGVRYTRAYSTAPVCSAARSALITGMYQSAISSEPHRKFSKARLPDGVRPITEYFRAQGYYVSNGNSDLSKKGKTDYNFKSGVPGGMYDGPDWSDRAEGQPFFAQVQIYEPHRDFVQDPDPSRRDRVEFPPYYPDHPITRADWANYLASIEVLDRKVGRVLDRLDREGLAGNTLVFFFGDHGRPHVRDKQWLYDGGIHVPLIVRWPGKLGPGAVDDRPVSLIDVSAASLAATGMEPPQHLHGVDMLAEDFRGREAVYASVGRLGGKVDYLRSVQVGDMKYIRNFRPNHPYMLGDMESTYKLNQYPVHSLLKALHTEGRLTPGQERFMAAIRPAEELYDLSQDPYELTNLADEPAHQQTLRQMRNRLAGWMDRIGDPVESQEPEADQARARQGDRPWRAKVLKKKGLGLDSMPAEHVEWWRQKLGLKPERS